MNKVIASIFILLGLGIVFCVTDCSAGRTRYFECNVSGHQYVAAWNETSVSTDSDGKMSVSTTYHPEEYHVICQQSDGDGAFDVSTSRAQYHTVADGQAVTVRTRIGKWTGIAWVPSIEL